MPGETVLSGAPKTCERCKMTPKPDVQFANGFIYIGTECRCGPKTRESDYYNSPVDAGADVQKYQDAFDGKGPIPETARKAGYQPGKLTIDTYDPSKGSFEDWILSN